MTSGDNVELHIFYFFLQTNRAILMSRQGWSTARRPTSR